MLGIWDSVTSEAENKRQVWGRQTCWFRVESLRDVHTLLLSCRKEKPAFPSLLGLREFGAGRGDCFRSAWLCQQQVLTLMGSGDRCANWKPGHRKTHLWQNQPLGPIRRNLTGENLVRLRLSSTMGHTLSILLSTSKCLSLSNHPFPMNLSANKVELQMEKTNLWLPGGKEGWRDKLGNWDWQIHTTTYKTENQQGPTVQHRER